MWCGWLRRGGGGKREASNGLPTKRRWETVVGVIRRRQEHDGRKSPGVREKKRNNSDGGATAQLERESKDSGGFYVGTTSTEWRRRAWSCNYSTVILPPTCRSSLHLLFFILFSPLNHQFITHHSSTTATLCSLRALDIESHLSRSETVDPADLLDLVQDQLRPCMGENLRTLGLRLNSALPAQHEPTHPESQIQDREIR